MRPIAALFWQLCLMRTGPDAMPGQPWFAAFVLALNLLASATLGLLNPSEPGVTSSLGVPVINAFALGATTWLLLHARGWPQRFLQTFAALLAVDLVLTVLFGPAVMLLTADATAGDVPGAALFLWFVLIMWLVTATGFIYSRALQVPQAAGVGIAVFVFFITILATQALFPTPPATESAL